MEMITFKLFWPGLNKERAFQSMFSLKTFFTKMAKWLWARILAYIPESLAFSMTPPLGDILVWLSLPKGCWLNFGGRDFTGTLEIMLELVKFAKGARQI